ncbi:hypothetical protein HDU76_012314 [Blyttiomyces sp. JEL0837]|nr:hypothetical protein HDU76_012314 [Blyttiomyces sp. JEL0837]
MKARTDLNVIALKRILEDDLLWKWIERPYSVRDQQILQSKERLKARLFDVRGLLLHIPMRRCWMSELPPSFMKPQYQIRLFVIASRFGHVDLAKTLLSMEQVKEHPGLSTAATFSLIWSSYDGFTDAVDMLLNIDGVDPTADNNHALRWSCQHGYTDITRLLLQDQQSKVDPTVDNNFPIRIAAGSGYLDIVKMLVGIDTVDASSCGYFAVLEAWKRGFVDVVKVLIDARNVVGSKVGGDLEIGVSLPVG